MIEIVPVVVTPFAQNCRILGDSESKRAIVIDPGGDVDVISGELASRRWTCEQIWLTHSHLDHCGGVKALKSASGARLYAHPDETMMRSNVRKICSMYGLPPDGFDDCPEPDVSIRGGETLRFAELDFSVHFTPGHSPGHVVFYQKDMKVLLAGDTLFAGSIGRTDLPGGDYDTLMRSLQSVLMVLPDDTQVLSGHGENTTIGVERVSNPFLQGR